MNKEVGVKVPKLITIRGNSGSGKTVLATKLQEKFGPNTMLISHDMIRMKMLHVWGIEGIDKSIPLLINLLQYGKLHSEYTILEGILPFKEFESVFDVAITEFGANIFAYYYDLNFEESLQRHDTKPNKHDFGEADMRRWWKEKDYLCTISEKIFNKELSLDDAISTVLNDVNY